jgi:hypothetical protein
MAGTLAYTQAGGRTSEILLSLSLVVRGAGLGAVIIPIMAAAYLGLRPDQVPHASSATRIMQQVGGSFGTAILAMILQIQLAAHQAGGVAAGPPHSTTRSGGRSGSQPWRSSPRSPCPEDQTAPVVPSSPAARRDRPAPPAVAGRHARRHQTRRGGKAAQGIDRMVRNIETGRFERSLSALTAAGALVTAAESYFDHDSASFGNKMMWLPIVLGPVAAAAGVADFFSRRLAKTALPVASAAIVANGLQGTYLHARGIGQKPGRWSDARYNTEMGPPLIAPLLVIMVGGVSLLAAVLRREK